MIRRVYKSRFLRDSAILQGSGMIVAASQLLSSVILAHVLGENDQGLFITALKIYGLYFMALNTGVVSATVSQVGAAVTRNQKEKVAAWQAFLLKAYLAIGLLLFGLGWLVLPPAAEYFFRDRQLGYWAWWLSLCPLLESLRVLAMATFQGTRKMKYLARLDVGTELGRLALISAAVLIFHTPQAAVVATILSCLVGSLWAVWLYRVSAEDEGTSNLPTLGSIVRRMPEVPLRVGLPLGLRLGFLRSLDALAYDLLPPLFLLFAGVQLELEDPEGWVTYFNIAQRVVLLPVILLSGIARTALPAMSGVAGRKDPEAFRRGFLRITLLGGGITILGLAVALLVLPIAVDIVYPSSYVEPVFLLAAILAIGHVIKGFSGAFDSFYIVADRLKAAMLISGISMLLAVPLMLWITLEHPRTGAAWGVNVTYAIGSFHYLYIAWFFYRGKHKGLFQPSPPKEPEPADEPAGG